ncbi:peptide/nickel transport system permease protein [Microbacterium phyllosphaerae]|uniref:Peptide/nickel transport system permease protein n=1 Tax=Microbacterium phyllosphaerae TaxID=124798 RepID=A0ABS4WTI4_9MICO|nr:ABC transporter permease [Microbacterium phyllosphaerae]MBP2379458.1 peptide/nickel transport system permease protein [Microbacterium phyllosphaerae]
MSVIASSAAVRLWRGGWSVRIALLVLVGVALLAVAGPALAPQDPLAQNASAALQEPSLAHLLGTDYLGRDVLSRLFAGAPASLISAVVAALIGLVLGAVPGALSAFVPRFAEWFSLRIVDALLALPFILFAIVFAALLGNGLVQATLAIGILVAPGFFRIARAATLRVRDSPYIDAAGYLGASAWWILRRHVWRQVAPNLVVASVSALGGALLAVASLTFLGIGVQPPAPTWGGMLSSDLGYLGQRPWGPLAPALAIIVTVGALNVVADAARDVLGAAAIVPTKRKAVAHV